MMQETLKNAAFAFIVFVIATLATPAMSQDFTNARSSPVTNDDSAHWPQYLIPFVDPAYGGTVTLSTGRSGTAMPFPPGGLWPTTSKGLVRHAYSSHQPWSADSALIRLHFGKVWLDGQTLRPLASQPNAPGGLWMWSPAEPGMMLITTSSGLIKWNAATRQTVQTISISGYRSFGFQTRTNPSHDGTKIGVKAIRSSDGKPFCLGVDLATGRVDRAISFDAWRFSRGGFAEDKARRCDVSPSGRYLVLEGYANNSYNDQGHWFDWATGALVHKQRGNRGVECPGGHGDQGIDQNGDDVFVGVCKGGGLSWSRPVSGRQVVLRIRDGAIWPIGPSSSHTSCRNSKRPGWCYGSSFGSSVPNSATIHAHKLVGPTNCNQDNVCSGSEPQRREIYLDPNNYRIAYDDETQAVPNPDGTKVLFISRWSDVFGEPRGRIYVVDLSELR